MSSASRAPASRRQHDAAPSGQADADLLIRQLESQLRRQRDMPATAAEFASAIQHWAARFRLALPELATEAEAIAQAFQGADLQRTGVRLERVGTAMRLLARLRSLMVGEAPRQVMLPGAEGPLPVDASDSGGEPASFRPRHGAPEALPIVQPVVRQTPPAPLPRPASTIRPVAPTAPPVSRVLAPAAQELPKREAPATRQAGQSARPASPGRARRVKAATPAGDLTFDTPIDKIPRFDRRNVAPLQNLHISTVGALLRHYPRRYLDYSKLLPIVQLKPGEEVTIEAVVRRC
ncbi:MAG TPA: hypothetical protein VGP33_07695, partial [Chloroflexota bacterium]|nr:hypothetical protein [Chloroflexota bacterium]